MHNMLKSGWKSYFKYLSFRNEMYLTKVRYFLPHFCEMNSVIMTGITAYFIKYDLAYRFDY